MIVSMGKPHPNFLRTSDLSFPHFYRFLVEFRLTLIREVLCDGSGQSSFSVIDVAYFIIIKYKFIGTGQRIEGKASQQANVAGILVTLPAVYETKKWLTNGAYIEVRLASVELCESSNR